MHYLTSQLLENSNTIFWDFDGVIKESVSVKALAFENLFSDFDHHIRAQIRQHHLEYIGLSRFEKIPIYLGFVGKTATAKTINEYSRKFSELVKQSVIDSPWVPGVEKYLKSNYQSKKFILITATPKDEICEIIVELGIAKYFQAVYGSPETKTNAMSIAIEKFQCDPKKTIMIGDSISDYNASISNNINFLLRESQFNLDLQKNLNCLMFKDFIYE